MFSPLLPGFQSALNGAAAPEGARAAAGPIGQSQRDLPFLLQMYRPTIEYQVKNWTHYNVERMIKR